MLYLEFLRVRRVAVWYAGIIVAIVAFIVIGALLGHDAHVAFSDSDSGGSSHVNVKGLDSLGIVPVPVEAFAGIAAFCAIAFATALAASFNRETAYAHFTFVRPIARLRMAALIAAVDVAAIFVGAIFAFVMAMLAVAGSLGSHAHYIFSSETFALVFLGLGAAFMWYAILQAVSSWTSGRGGGFVGLAAGLMGFALPGSHWTFLGPIVYVFRAILYIDPLAYFSSVTTSGSAVTVGSFSPGSMLERGLSAWILGAVFLGIAAFFWNRVEV